MPDPTTDTPDTSCWTCAHNKNWGHETFLGFCTAPARNNETGAKQIPPHIVDKGCKKHTPRPDKATP
jgi:hypothetical protein